MINVNDPDYVLEEELTLLGLYLASWTEKDVPGFRAWKNHRFEILDTLAEKGYLQSSRGAKSVYITPEGLTKAKELKEKYAKTAGL
ncbi:MAG: hypothetical protein A2X28_07215 [Elusimicrobia bacterium GWA2_56_46]|nr:MAG: hypothetical protein A2X28_07215 [Elusimicrobia bacterium GWA2_56_46]OGR54766.1 MAG: hypothetical protein A2X39_10775 [Elusimicrobia bacterium GWC2_56_31]HBB66024.1 transposase [Elusimicrobiota bacterium]HBW23444.1 transposase [Elusimicrobiota bacterium]